eukprot:656325-Amphidinium_carterae.1
MEKCQVGVESALGASLALLLQCCALCPSEEFDMRTQIMEDPKLALRSKMSQEDSCRWSATCAKLRRSRYGRAREQSYSSDRTKLAAHQ